jgi:hypothetical protein
MAQRTAIKSAGVFSLEHVENRRQVSGVFFKDGLQLEVGISSCIIHPSEGVDV